MEWIKFYHARQLLIFIAIFILIRILGAFICGEDLLAQMKADLGVLSSVIPILCLLWWMAGCIIVFKKSKNQHVELFYDYLTVVDSNFFWEKNEEKTIMYKDIDCVKIFIRCTKWFRYYDIEIFLKNNNRTVTFKNIWNYKLFCSELKDRWINVHEPEKIWRFDWN